MVMGLQMTTLRQEKQVSLTSHAVRVGTGFKVRTCTHVAFAAITQTQLKVINAQYVGNCRMGTHTETAKLLQVERVLKYLTCV